MADLISYTKALEIVLSNVQNFGVETIDLENSLNRVLVEDVFADRDYPPFNRAAMDGIAVAINDIENGITQFTITETIYAGQSCAQILNPGQCFKIMTGAAVPLCANLVIRIEDIELNNQTAKIQSRNLKLFQNIAQQGQDIKNGQLAIAKGTKITASIIGLLATVGKQKVMVNKMPNVAIITTGNEIIEVGKTVSEVQIRNSNQYVISALLQKCNILPSIKQHILDDQILLENGIKQHLNNNILILCGGVSAGDADFVPAVLTKLGVQKLFHKVAIKPGKPIWCGKMPNGPMVFALPGNPFSCLVTFTLFIQPFINKCIGLQNAVNLTLPYYENRSQKTKFDEFFPIIIDFENQVLRPVPINGSGDIRLGLQANGLALHNANVSQIFPKQKLSYFKL